MKHKKRIAKSEGSDSDHAPKKDRGREATMQKLIDTGFEVFSEVGFNGATTRMISQRSGVNESLIIRYFKSKSGLFLAILESFFQRQCANEVHYQPGQTVEQEIENYLQFQIEQSLLNRDFMRISISQIAIDKETRKQVQDMFNSTLETVSSPIETRLREFQKAGAIRKDVTIEQITDTLDMHAYGIRFIITLSPEFEKEKAFKEIRFFAQNLGHSLRT